MIGADSTGTFSDVQTVVMGIAVLALLGTLGLSLLGLPVGVTGVAFVVLFALLLAVGWSTPEDVQPRHDTDGE